MNRQSALCALSEGRYDLLVIGGGITGVGVAREAALRGLRVALAEQHDFASGTSSRSTKLIHGGLRYLKRMDFRLVRESVQERQRLLQMAPHLVSARPFLFPVYRGDPDGLFALRMGLILYDWFAGTSNSMPHRLLRVAEVAQSEPLLSRQHLLGGCLYCDCTTDDARLTFEVLRSAVEYGAVAVNYAAVEAFLYGAGGQMVGARLCDRLSGEPFAVQADRVLAAAGPWADHMRRLDDPAAPPVLRLTKGVHLTFGHERLPLREPVVLRGGDGRLMFAVPSGNFTYVGTTDTDYWREPEALQIERVDVAYVLDAAARAFPDAHLGPADVCSAWAGLRPLVRPHGHAGPSSVSRDYVLYRSRSGLATVAGGKLTAFRAMAVHLVDDLFPETRDRSHHVRSTAPLTPAAPAPPGSPDDLSWLLSRLRHAVLHEMAVRLEDVLVRRTGALLFSKANGLTHLDILAATMGEMLDWSPNRVQEERNRCRTLIAEMFAWRDEV